MNTTIETRRSISMKLILTSDDEKLHVTIEMSMDTNEELRAVDLRNDVYIAVKKFEDAPLLPPKSCKTCLHYITRSNGKCVACHHHAHWTSTNLSANLAAQPEKTGARQ